ncbi:MAG TPA: hypothetical protein VH438_11150 [Gemmatimonadales bacterium]
MMSPEYAWLTGRELLIGELEVRIEAMRARAEAGTVRGFRAGLLVFLDRRLNRVRSALATLRHLPGAFSDGRRQTVDRMVSAIIGTLRHAEITLRGESGTAPPPEPDSRDERRRGERRKYPSRRGARLPVPAGEDEEPESQPEPGRDRDVGDGS